MEKNQDPKGGPTNPTYRQVNGQEICRIERRDIRIELVSDDADVLSLANIAYEIYTKLNENGGRNSPKYIS